jgi:hypothetical protein
MKLRLARHDETPFNVFFTSPEKVSLLVFSHLESLREKMRDFKGILSTRMQMLRERRGCETRRVSLFLCLC